MTVWREFSYSKLLQVDVSFWTKPFVMLSKKLINEYKFLHLVRIYDFKVIEESVFRGSAEGAYKKRTYLIIIEKCKSDFLILSLAYR